MNTRLQRTYRVFDIILYIIATLLLVFVAYKASVSSFTHDESYTYNSYVVASFHNIFSFAPLTANNHLLNTLLIKLFAFCFGTSEFVLRLPNVIAFAFYLYFVIQILKKSSNRYLKFPFFIFFTLNPYFLDFFALARGYGLGFCFMVGSIFFLISFFEDNKRKYRTLSFLFASLAVLSNFVFLYFYISLLVVYNLCFFLSKRNNENNSNCIAQIINYNHITLIFTLVLAAIIFAPIRKLIMSNQLYDGGNNGFIADTLWSLIGGSFYGMEYKCRGTIILIERWFFILNLVVSFVVLLFLKLTKKGRQIVNNQTYFILCTFIVVIWSIVMLAHHLFGTKFLHNRMALFLIPLFVISFYSIVEVVSQQKFIRKIILPIIYLVSFFVVFHFFKSALPNSYLEWQYDKNTKRMLSLLKADATEYYPNDSVINIGITWLFEPSINFYRQLDSLDWLQEVDRGGIENRNFNYLYLKKDDFEKLPNKNQYNVVVEFNDSETVLIRTNNV